VAQKGDFGAGVRKEEGTIFQILLDQQRRDFR
jgi:hypothetical protein